jgi:hypothetical protein
MKEENWTFTFRLFLFADLEHLFGVKAEVLRWLLRPLSSRRSAVDRSFTPGSEMVYHDHK